MGARRLRTGAIAFNLLGRTGLKLFDLGVGLSMNTGGPYNETLAWIFQQRPRTRTARGRAAQQPRHHGIRVARHSRLRDLKLAPAGRARVLRLDAFTC